MILLPSQWFIMIHEANNSINLDLPLMWMKKKTLKNFNDLFSPRNWLARRTRIVRES